MGAKGITETQHIAVAKMVVARLGLFARMGVVVKTGERRDARWATAWLGYPRRFEPDEHEDNYCYADEGISANELGF
jgi:hypothetical protein